MTVSGLALTGADAGNYILTQPTTTADITAATLTVTGITAEQQGLRRHHRRDARHQGAVLSGVVAGDDVTLDAAGATGAFDTKNVGTARR